MKLFYRLTPHSYLKGDPLFDFESRRLRDGASAETLIVSTFRRIGIICVVLFLIWLALELSDSSVYRRSSVSFLSLLFGLSLFAGLLLDFSSMSNAFDSFTAEITTRRMDLLRLSLGVERILDDKHGVAQLRVWRTMSLVIGVRAAVVLLAVLTVLLAFVRDIQFNQFSTLANPVSVLANIILLLIGIACGGVYVIEPLWRTRAVTALGLAISVRTQQPVSAVMGAVGTIAILWLGQSFVAGAVMFLIVPLLVPLGFMEMSSFRILICAPLLFFLIILITVYSFYFIIQMSALRRAERFATRLD